MGPAVVDSLALVWVTSEALAGSTRGGAGGTKAWSGPKLVPPKFEATTRKWYVVPGTRPVTIVLTAWVVSSSPIGALSSVLLSYAVLVPYSTM